MSEEQKIAISALVRQLVALLELRRDSGENTVAADPTKVPGDVMMICAWCKRVRKRDGSWVNRRLCFDWGAATFVSHGICQECFEHQRSNAHNFCRRAESGRPDACNP